MTDYWVSTARHFCPICKCWLSGHKMNINNHEKSERHLELQKRLMKDMRVREREREKESHDLKLEIERISRAADIAIQDQDNRIRTGDRINNNNNNNNTSSVISTNRSTPTASGSVMMMRGGLMGPSVPPDDRGGSIMGESINNNNNKYINRDHMDDKGRGGGDEREVKRLKTDMSSNWVMTVGTEEGSGDKSAQKTFYYNTVTGETRSDAPIGCGTSNSSQYDASNSRWDNPSMSHKLNKSQQVNDVLMSNIQSIAETYSQRILTNPSNYIYNNQQTPAPVPTPPAPVPTPPDPPPAIPLPPSERPSVQTNHNDRRREEKSDNSRTSSDTNNNINNNNINNRDRGKGNRDNNDVKLEGVKVEDEKVDEEGRVIKDEESQQIKNDSQQIKNDSQQVEKEGGEGLVFGGGEWEEVKEEDTKFGDCTVFDGEGGGSRGGGEGKRKKEINNWDGSGGQRSDGDGQRIEGEEDEDPMLRIRHNTAWFPLLNCHDLKRSQKISFTERKAKLNPSVSPSEPEVKSESQGGGGFKRRILKSKQNIKTPTE